MATIDIQGKKISQLEVATTLSGDELIPFAKGGKSSVAKSSLLKGQKGDDGKSAYQAAKEKGYTGTEDEFNASLAAIPGIEQDVETLKLMNSFDYYVAGWDPENLDPNAVAFNGNKEFANNWNFYLIDTTDNAGTKTTPVGKLQRGNLLRFQDGSFAPTVGITEEMRAECDVELYLDAEHTQKYCDAGAFDATSFYTEHGMAKLYNAEGEEVRVLRPWETTETKYSIGIGRDQTVYLLDNVVGKSGKMWAGLFAKATIWDGIDVSAYPLAPTAFMPCPVITIGNKARCFFYVYEAGDNNCKGYQGNSGLCTMFKNGRMYPRVGDMHQINDMVWSRANNADPDKPYPFAEGGFHALNAFTISQEIYYGRKSLHTGSMFGSGISSNDGCSNESTWKGNGGIRYKLSTDETWKYASWYQNSGDIYYNASGGRTTFSSLVNTESPKEQCLESQMAASFAKETNVAEGVEFDFYGSTYWYKSVPNTNGLDGMNVKVFKTMSQTFDAYNASGELVSWDMEVVLRFSLYGGVSLCGDTYMYCGGGYEQVGTVVNDPNVNRAGNKFKLYMEPDQTKWLKESTVTKNDLGVFDFESAYPLIGEYTSLGNSYTKTRAPYTGWKTEKGGSLLTGQCYYHYDDNYWGSVLGARIRVAARFRGLAIIGICSPRLLYASAPVSSARRYYAGSAQVLI